MDSANTRVLLSEARRQAVRGSSGAALRVLDQIPGSGAAALRARILCQQGQFAAAVPHWNEALAADPGSEETKRGLARAEKLARSPAGRLRLHSRRWALAVAVLAVLVLAGWGTIRIPASGPSSRDLLDQLSRMQGQISDLKKDSQKASNDLASRLAQAENETKRSQNETQTQLNRIRRSVTDLKNNLARP